VNRESVVQKTRARYFKLKVDVFTAYSNGGEPRCADCGEQKLEFLSIDHVDSDGASHRRKIGKSLYLWLRRNGFPGGFQILCHNHNALKFIASVTGKSKKAAYLLEVKKAVVNYYSGGVNKCSECDVSDIRILTIDHICGGGAAHRRQERIKSMARWLQKSGYPPGYRILCHNHNSGSTCLKDSRLRE
jgi:hypothetical protein